MPYRLLRIVAKIRANRGLDETVSQDCANDCATPNIHFCNATVNRRKSVRLRRRGGSYDGAMPRIAKIGIIAALPREVAGLVRGIAADPSLVREGIWLYRMEGAVVVSAGMGAERVAAAVEAAGAVEVLVSVGLAGGCRAGVEVGAVMEAGVVVEVGTGERFVAGSGDGVTLATVGAIASVEEKARLAERFGATIVDMEAATVARIAMARGVGFRAIKGISDGAEFELEGLGKFEGERGSFRTGAFAAYTAVRPWTWGKAVELGRGTAKALAGLEAALRGVIAER
jgi:adenosylhomocysteine nucleosidase